LETGTAAELAGIYEKVCMYRYKILVWIFYKFAGGR
jgi:hypothetical protein